MEPQLPGTLARLRTWPVAGSMPSSCTRPEEPHASSHSRPPPAASWPPMAMPGMCTRSVTAFVLTLIRTRSPVSVIAQTASPVPVMLMTFRTPMRAVIAEG